MIMFSILSGISFIAWSVTKHNALTLRFSNSTTSNLVVILIAKNHDAVDDIS